MTSRLSPQFLLQLARFLLVGGLSTGFYFLLLALLSGTIANTIVLTALCYAISMGLNYLAQSHFTFKAMPQGPSVVRYCVMHAAAMVANSALMTLLVDGLAINLFIAQLFVSGLLALSTFLISKFWVYQPAVAHAPDAKHDQLRGV